jgi:flagella basal body P-ring formation protein FlgA
MTFMQLLSLNLPRLVNYKVEQLPRQIAIARKPGDMQPHRLHLSWFLFGASVLAILSPAASPQCLAEDQVVMRFVETPRTKNHVVRLGDLVEVLAGRSPTVDQWLEMPLGPAPRDGVPQTWYSRDVLQHLELHGVHPNSVRWSGRDVAQLQRVDDSVETDGVKLTPAFVQSRVFQQAENLVKQAIVEYLNLRTGERVDWRISLQIPSDLATLVKVRKNIMSIGGGVEPWSGEQKFVLQIQDRDLVQNVVIVANVDLPPMVVVAKRPLRREEIIHADALEYAPLPITATIEQGKHFNDFDQLVGKQVKRSISTGVPIVETYIGEPVVIQRNEMVEVECVSGAVVVRTTARSLSSGAVGELVEVELLPSKHRMLATVAGPMQVRVAAIASRGSVNR